eukprot:3773333-Amphidinium_carterae.1
MPFIPSSLRGGAPNLAHVRHVQKDVYKEPMETCPTVDMTCKLTYSSNDLGLNGTINSKSTYYKKRGKTRLKRQSHCLTVSYTFL